MVRPPIPADKPRTAAASSVATFSQAPSTPRQQTPVISVTPAPVPAKKEESASRFQEQNPEKCTFEGCNFVCATKKKLRKHKIETKEHDYCAICNVDCADYDELTAHKWKEGCTITCKYCGQDFKTEGARDKHQKVSHPVLQEIPCIGCGMTFGKASGLISHLENGRCRKITKEQFLGYLQHKNIVGKLLSSPELIQTITLTDWQAVARDTDVSGGVSLLDSPAPALGASSSPASRMTPLIPTSPVPLGAEVKLGGPGRNVLEEDSWEMEAMPGEILTPKKAPEPTQRLGERWPALPPNKSSHRPSASVAGYDQDETESIVSTKGPAWEDLEWSAGTNPVPMGDLITGIYGMNVRDNIRPSKTFVPEYRAISSIKTASGATVTSSAFSRTPATKSSAWGAGPTSGTMTNTVAKPSPWGGAAAKKLFPDAKATPMTNEWAAALANKTKEEEENKELNLLQTRFWDPTSTQYNPELFFNPILEKYQCPFPQCQESFDKKDRDELEKHMNFVHRYIEVRCPSCLKLFRSTTALIAHCEAPSNRCRITSSNNFRQAINQFTGGFVDAQIKLRPDYDKSCITYAKFEAQKPMAWEDESEGVVIGERGIW